MNELKRILSDKRRAAILLILPIICIGLFLFDRMGGNLRIGWRLMVDEGREYRETIDKYRGMEANEIIKLSADECRYQKQPNAYSQAVYIKDFAGYYDAVEKQAAKLKSSSVFSVDPNSFSFRNIQKTAKDFSRMKGVTAEFGSNRAIERWLGFGTADLIFLAAIIIVVLAFFEENRKGLSALIRSCPNGRLKLALSRMGVLFFFSFAFTVLMYGSTLIASFMIDGGITDLDRSIQSIEGFKTLTLRVTISEWLMLYFGVRVVTGVFIGLFFWFVLSFLSHIQLSWLVIIGITAAEYAAYTLIAPQMALSILRYVNIFSYISPTVLLSKYVNMNVFGYPVGTLTFMGVLLAVLLVGLTAGVVILRLKRYPFGNRDVLGKAIKLWNTVMDAARSRMTLLPIETYKLIILGGSFLFIAVGICIGRDLGYEGYAYSMQEPRAYPEYMKEIEGQITDATFDYIEKARSNLDLYSGIAEDFSGALDAIEADANAVLERSKEKGFDPVLVDQYSINDFIGEKGWYRHRGNAFIALAFVILISAPVFSFEKQGGTELLLRSTPRGRRSVFIRKYAVIFLETLLLWAVIYLREWIGTAKLIGDTALNANIGNINMLADFPVSMSLKAFLACVFMLRLVAMLMAASFTARLSLRLGTWEKTVLAAAGMLLVPAGLCYFDSTWAGFISLSPFITGYEALTDFTGAQPLTYMLILWFLLALISILSSYVLWVPPKKGRVG